MSYSRGEEIAEMIEDSTDLTSDDIEIIFLALKEKRDKLARRLHLRLEKGDRVVIRSIKPKYLQGFRATVEGKSQGKVDIVIDEGYNTRRYGHKLRVPAACLERVEDE